MVQAEKKLFTVEDYYKMFDEGIIKRGERLELIKGEITKMSPIRSPHAGMVNLLMEELVEYFSGKYIVAVQNPIQISDTSEPEPDLTVLKFRKDRYSRHHPQSEDVYLLIEVADTSLSFDRGVKKVLYAEAGIPEYWIINLNDQQIEIFRNPHKGDYLESKIARKGDEVTCVSLEFTLNAGSIFLSDK